MIPNPVHHQLISTAILSTMLVLAPHTHANKGEAAAMKFVGWMYFRGISVTQNPPLAAGYFKSAADKSATAAWNFGQCYFAAQGVEHDIPKALEAGKTPPRWGTDARPPSGGTPSPARKIIAAVGFP